VDTSPPTSCRSACLLASAASSLTARVFGCRLTLFEETNGNQLQASVMIEAAAGVESALPSHAGRVGLITHAAVDVVRTSAIERE